MKTNKLLKSLAILIALMTTIISAQTTAWYGNNPNASTFYISTEQDLMGLAQLVNNGITNFHGRTIVLQENISLTGNHTPIGSTDARAFRGIFDGNGRTISNLRVLRIERAGLFGTVGVDGQIRNLTVNVGVINGIGAAGGLAAVYNSTRPVEFSIVNITGGITTLITGNQSTPTDAGGLIGRTTAELTIRNSSSAGRVQTEGNFFTRSGGLVGNATSALTISGSHATGNISASSSGGTGYRAVLSGGLIGYAGRAIQITNSYSTGNITASAGSTSSSIQASPYSGGLVGASGSSITLTINNSYATGDVVATVLGHALAGSIAYSGGLVGSGRVAINNSYSTGNVSGEINTDHFLGGLLGLAETGSNITHSYASGRISATGTGTRRSVGGIVGIVVSSMHATSVYFNSAGATSAAGSGTPTGIMSVSLAALRQQGTFANWNFNTIWGISANVNNGFPYLRELACAGGYGVSIHTWNDWSDWSTTTAATCTVSGRRTRTSACIFCGRATTETQSIAALGHLFDWVETTPATSTTPAEETGTCTREGCNHVEVRTLVLNWVEFGDFEIVSIPDQLYSGEAITPAIKVRLKSDKTVLTEDVDYEVSFGENRNVATGGKITMTAIGDYAMGGTHIVEFNILPRELTIDVSEATAENKVFDGTTTATIKGAVLVGVVENDDVSIATQTGVFADRNVGENKEVVATFTIEGTSAGNYILTQNTATLTADITRRPLVISLYPKTIVMAISDEIPNLAEFLHFNSLGEGDTPADISGTTNIVHSFVSGTSPVNAYTITLQGMRTSPNYTISYDNVGLFLIVEQDPVDVNTLTVSPIPDQTRTGEAIEPSIVLRDGEITLTEGLHYTLEYFNNVNVGNNAIITITGMPSGGYTGTRNVMFRIIPDGSTSIRDKQNSDTRYGIILENAVVSDFARISVITPEAATANIRIFDNLGNVVFSTNDVRAGLKPAPTADGAIVWNLTNQSGRFVANGAYLIVVEATTISGRRYLYSTRIGVSK